MHIIELYNLRLNEIKFKVDQPISFYVVNIWWGWSGGMGVKYCWYVNMLICIYLCIIILHEIQFLNNTFILLKLNDWYGVCYSRGVLRIKSSGINPYGGLALHDKPLIRCLIRVFSIV